MSVIEVEVYALSDMNTAFRKLHGSLVESCEQARAGVEIERIRLESIEQQCQNKLRECYRALQRCQSYRDDDGFPFPCIAEEVALQRASTELAAIQQHISDFSDRTDNYLRQVGRYRQELESAITNARANLEQHIEASLTFLQQHPEQLGSVEGAGTHGSLYERARREFIRRGAAGETPHINRRQQNWLRRQVVQGGYYRSPPYYDTGHRVAGVDVPENMRFENFRSNRAQPHIARRLGLPPTYF